MKNNLTPEQLKSKTKEWLNKYGKYILAGLTVLSLIGTFVACTAFKSSCAPSGTIFNQSGYAGTVVDSIDIIREDEDYTLRISNDDRLDSVGGVVTDEAEISYYYVESNWDSDIYEFGCSNGNIPAFRVSSRSLLYEYIDGASYQPFDVTCYQANLINGGTAEFVVYTYYYYYASDGTLLHEDTEFEYLHLTKSPGDYTDYVIEVTAYPDEYLPTDIADEVSYVGLDFVITGEATSNWFVSCWTKQYGLHEDPVIIERIVEQPVYTRWSIVETVTSAIDSMFELEFLGGLSFGTFFGMLIALPVMFFIMKTFLGG